MQKSIDIFLGYAVEDKELCLEVMKRLKGLEREGVIRISHEYSISAGMKREYELLHHLGMAHIILLFISADFLFSDFCYDVVLMQAMERHGRGDAHVIPIILRSVDWQETPLGKLDALPKGDKPVQSYFNRDEVLTEIGASIRVVVNNLVSKIYIQEGVASCKQEQYENTLEACEHALHWTPAAPIAYRLKGLALLKLKRYDEAVQVYDQIIHPISDDTSSIYKERGDALYHLHQYDNALISYKEAISLKNDFIAAYKGASNTLREIAKANIRLAEMYDEQAHKLSQLEGTSIQEDFQ
jgi:tetratricopeptide (TPR) repeat protein